MKQNKIKKKRKYDKERARIRSKALSAQRKIVLSMPPKELMERVGYYEE